MNIYVGNLSYDVTDGVLAEAFKRYGNVTSAKVITDHATGRSKGFGFVEMASSDEAQTAIEELNGTDLLGRTITVNEARPRDDRPPRSGGGFRREGGAPPRGGFGNRGGGGGNGGGGYGGRGGRGR